MAGTDVLLPGVLRKNVMLEVMQPLATGTRDASRRESVGQ